MIRVENNSIIFLEVKLLAYFEFSLYEIPKMPLSLLSLTLAVPGHHRRSHYRRRSHCRRCWRLFTRKHNSHR